MGFCLLLFFLGWWERNKGSGGEPLARQVKAAQGAGRYGAASRGWGGVPKKPAALWLCAPQSPHAALFLRRGFFFLIDAPDFPPARRDRAPSSATRPRRRRNCRFIPLPPPQSPPRIPGSAAAGWEHLPLPPADALSPGSQVSAPQGGSGLAPSPPSPGRVGLKPKGKLGSPSTPHTASRWDFSPTRGLSVLPTVLSLVGGQMEPRGRRGRWLQKKKSSREGNVSPKHPKESYRRDALLEKKRSKQQAETSPGAAWCQGAPAPPRGCPEPASKTKHCWQLLVPGQKAQLQPGHCHAWHSRGPTRPALARLFF